MRAHAILLSSRQYSIDQIASIYQVDRERVSQWFEWWTAEEFDGLDDDERGGRQPKLNAAEKEQVQELVKEEPRSLRRAVALIAERMEKIISSEILKRVVRGGQQVGKRLRLGRERTARRGAVSGLSSGVGTLAAAARSRDE